MIAVFKKLSLFRKIKNCKNSDQDSKAHKVLNMCGVIFVKL